MQIDSFVAYHARYRPDQPAILCGDLVWTYSKLDELVSRCGNGFMSLGIRPGDRIAILTENDPWFLVALLASARIGALCVPLNYRLAAPELIEQLAQARPQLLVGQAKHVDRIYGGPHGPLPKRIVTVGNTSKGSGPNLEGLVNDAGTARPKVYVSASSPVLLQFTSGTTGRPKGVLTTHAGWFQSCLIQAPLKRLYVGSTLLAPLPMCHTGGTKWMLEALLAGAVTVVMKSFDAEAALDAIDRHGVTNVGVAPTMLYQMLAARCVTKHALTTLRYMNSGGAALDADRVRQVINEFQCQFTQGYGMTEVAGGTIAICGPDDQLVDDLVSPRLASVGRPLIDCEVRIVDEAGSQVEKGCSGEIWLRTSRICIGYVSDTDSAAPVDDDGFYHTGDIAREDDDGYLYILDRAKDMIVSGGLNIYSREVEDALQKHPDVQEACVIGEPDDLWGEIVHAFVVLRDGRVCTGETLQEWCRTLIAGYKRPRRISFVTGQDLPRTAMGKVQKQALRANLRSA